MSRQLLWVVLCLSCVFTVARADETGGWRAAYREGTRYFDVGDFRAALDAFKRAYVAHEEAGILFDIGECHRHLGESADAVHAYRGYLRKKPDAANRSEVEALVAQLEGTSAPPPTAKTSAPKTAPAAPTTTPAATATPPTAAPPTAAPPTAAPPTAAPPTAAPPATTAAPPPAAPAPHGSVYDPWGSGAPPAAAPPPTPAASPMPTAAPAAAAAPAATAAPADAAAPAATATTATTAPPPAWAASATRDAEPPRHRSKAWIAAIVVPSVVVLAVSIGVTAWYFSPAPTYTRVGPAQ